MSMDMVREVIHCNAVHEIEDACLEGLSMKWQMPFKMSLLIVFVVMHCNSGPT